MEEHKRRWNRDARAPGFLQIFHSCWRMFESRVTARYNLHNIVAKVRLKGAGFGGSFTAFSLKGITCLMHHWTMVVANKAIDLQARSSTESPAVLPYFLSSSDWYLLPMQSTSLARELTVCPVPTYYNILQHTTRTLHLARSANVGKVSNITKLSQLSLNVPFSRWCPVRARHRSTWLEASLTSWENRSFSENLGGKTVHPFLNHQLLYENVSTWQFGGYTNHF